MRPMIEKMPQTCSPPEKYKQRPKVVKGFMSYNVIMYLSWFNYTDGSRIKVVLWNSLHSKAK